ncbi:aldo/keto reductase [Evansella halocellulosilytica]|uniref:aldo/keto reductase n=1 Tax=Evansella halocellulosilytica TaxID=2011013 RepID=UPI0027B88485|nr:aldo/keto reductase [Evansella halocellulosilytica]
MQLVQIHQPTGKKRIEKQCTNLIMGTAHLYPDRLEHACGMLDAYLEAGGNTLDTAHQYEGSEEVVGEWLEKSKKRDQIQLITKGAHPDDGEPGNRVNRDLVKKDLYESLDRLKTDYIDFYALHRDDPNVEVGPIIEALNEHIETGCIHTIGVSNWSNERIQEANDYAVANGLVGFTFNSPNLSLAKCNEPRWPGCISLDKKGIDWHAENQLPVFSWSSQAGGFFSARFSPEDRSNREMVRVYYSPENWERFHRASVLAEEKKVTPIQIALAYVVNQPFPTAAIIGPETKEELLSSVEGANITLSKHDMDWLDLLRDSR